MNAEQILTRTFSSQRFQAKKEIKNSEVCPFQGLWLGAANSFRAFFSENDIEVTIFESYNPVNHDFESILRRVRTKYIRVLIQLRCLRVCSGCTVDSRLCTCCKRQSTKIYLFSSATGKIMGKCCGRQICFKCMVADGHGSPLMAIPCSQLNI